MKWLPAILSLTVLPILLIALGCFIDAGTGWLTSTSIDAMTGRLILSFLWCMLTVTSIMFGVDP